MKSVKLYETSRWNVDINRRFDRRPILSFVYLHNCSSNSVHPYPFSGIRVARRLSTRLGSCRARSTIVEYTERNLVDEFRRTNEKRNRHGDGPRNALLRFLSRNLERRASTRMYQRTSRRVACRDRDLPTRLPSERTSCVDEYAGI